MLETDAAELVEQHHLMDEIEHEDFFLVVHRGVVDVDPERNNAS